MKTYLLIDSDTRLEFKNRAQAFIYADKKSIPSMVLTIYDLDSGLDCSVYNPFLVDDQSKEYGVVTYFKTESDAMTHIESFI